MSDERQAQQMNLCAFRVQQTICLRGFKRRAVCDAVSKTHNHHASHDDCSSRSTPYGVATFHRASHGGVGQLSRTHKHAYLVGTKPCHPIQTHTKGFLICLPLWSVSDSSFPFLTLSFIILEQNNNNKNFLKFYEPGWV